ncbi:MAG: hypothetical protein RLY71_2897 [Pseudomonadota bacterium]
MPPEPQRRDNQRPARLPDRPTVTDDDIIQLSDELIHTRQHIGPKHLVEPAPDAATLRELFAAAAAGRLRYGSGLSGGRALRTDMLRQAFGIAEGEHAICFISLGTPTRSKPIRPRPAVDDFVRWL